MALTAAERSKRYRDNKKKNPETHSAYLNKERERYKARKVKGEYDYSKKSAREMNLQRRKWRQIKKNEREKKKNVRKGTEFMNINSPCTSPERPDYPIEAPISNNEPKVRSPNDKHPSHQALSGQKRARCNRIRSNKMIRKLVHEKEVYQRLWERSRKRAQRYKHYDKIKSNKVPRWKVDLKTTVRKFLEEDINSTQAPGIKDTITVNKIKKQKRYLVNTLLNLYKKFKETHPTITLSYVGFCRLRPFWIVNKKVESRDTCLCKLHENVKLRVSKLKTMNVINEGNPDEIAKQLVCDVHNKTCAYRECGVCKTKQLEHAADFTEERFGEQVAYYQWGNRTEVISTKEGSRTVQKTVKLSEQCTLLTLVEDTTTLLSERYLRHTFNVSHQYKVMKAKKDTLTSSEAVLYVDFSENYNCKLGEVIQAMHFGGSRNQVSLHTVVMYTRERTESFCTVSENTHHGPGAIWAHLKPIMEYMKDAFQEVKSVHFLSDGPCTQYRSKNHFFLYHQEMMQNYSFDSSTWNFTESGHGKSAADGIGATVKRTADRLVANGHDIPDAISFYNAVSENVLRVRLFLVETDLIQTYIDSIPKSLDTVKGTLKVHQVSIDQNHKGLMRLKVLSCFCTWPNPCNCFPGVSAEHRIATHTDPAVAATLEAGSTDDTCIPEEQIDRVAAKLLPDTDLVGTWCAVRYDGQAYPGIIQDIDAESAEIKCMSRIGVNRYFWPLLEDIIWYKWEDVIMEIPEPQHVTSRHVEIDAESWKSISNLLVA